MSGKRSRDRGKRGEREVWHLLEDVYPDARRSANQSRRGSDAPDVDGTPYWIEVKFTEKERIRAAYNQATEATDGRPVLVLSRRSHTPWLVTMDAETFKALVLSRRESEQAVRPASEGLEPSENP